MIKLENKIIINEKLNIIAHNGDDNELYNIQ